MAYYAVTSESDELIPLSDLVFPVRIYFIVSDSNEGEKFSFPVSYYNISNQVVSETFNLPFVYEMSGKYFYSFIQNSVASLQSEEETPTPTETPTIDSCATSPVTITVSSEYDSSTNTRTYKYTTSDSNENGGLFGCINVNRGDTLTILARGEYSELITHPLKITNYNDQGQEMGALDGVIRTDTGGQNNDGTYFLTWLVPCDESINQYQYQCTRHAHMRGTINVLGECPTPTPEKTPTPEQPTPTPSPYVDCVTLTSANNKGYDENTPVKHEAGGTFYWCKGTQYIDPGVQNVVDCLGDTLTIENGGIEVQYWNQQKTTQITDSQEIEKLGLETSFLGPHDYTFTVRYKAISANGKTSISGGRIIKVVTKDSVSDDKNPCPIIDEPTPTPTPVNVDEAQDKSSVCIDGITLNNNDIYRGVQLKYSSGQIVVDAKEYSPTPSIPTIIYMYLDTTDTENFVGRITINSRVNGVSSDTFNNTTISYVHSDGKCYNYDLDGLIGNENHIVFGERAVSDVTTEQSCCENLQIISKESNNKYGIRLSDSEGRICIDPKNYTHSFGLPTVVYIYIGNYSSHGQTYRGKITFQNRVGGLGSTSFNSDNLIYIDSDNKCYNINLSDINELNNIKIFNTYN